MKYEHASRILSPVITTEISPLQVKKTKSPIF